MDEYLALTLVSKIFKFLGWLVVALGVVAAGITLFTSVGYEGFATRRNISNVSEIVTSFLPATFGKAANTMDFFSSLATALKGLFVIALGELITLLFAIVINTRKAAELGLAKSSGSGFKV